ncbi:hypothetical protein AWZ03_002428 [Drosophila navojoa]|uniref:Protein transport protein Sec61 subunit gamma n=1 Tax=Drosophila navojoa TaxID=7232 RepID=A0A484BT70_DRONA|nr:protein transport protein Sec61 subunit gamma [Drosophila navojoa]TDG51065.1 hypothetical protein AWZ03_002428 [Drosophila navojoa]
MDQRLQRRRRAPRKKHKTGLAKLLPDLSPNLRSTAKYTHLLWNQLMSLLLPLVRFVKETLRVIKRYKKPDLQEFQRSVLAITIGFLIMGFLGFIIKLLYIPITNIIMG